MVYEYRSTRDTGDRGGGAPRKPFPVTRKRQGRGKVPFPLPVEPPPPIGDIPSIQCPGIWQSRRGLTENSMKSRFLPVHGIRTIAMHCPPPGRGREEAARAAGRWG